jgi:hypothetical protein
MVRAGAAPQHETPVSSVAILSEPAIRTGRRSALPRDRRPPVLHERVRPEPKTIPMFAAGSITTNPDLTITDPAVQTINIISNAVNLNASNGVIHAIDTLMLPFVPDAPTDPPTSPGAPGPPDESLTLTVRP